MPIRITVYHINKYGPLVFPAKQSQVFIPDHKVPKTMLTGFYQRIVECWLKEHPDRQQFGDYVKDIVANDAMCDGAKMYSPTNEALGKGPAVTEEEI